MAFTGAAVIALPSRGLARITGLSLGAGATGNIGLNGSGAEVELPAQVQWAPYAGDDDGDDIINLDESVAVSFIELGSGAAPTEISIAKSNGGDPATFNIEFENNDGGNATPGLEIWLRFH